MKGVVLLCCPRLTPRALRRTNGARNEGEMKSIVVGQGRWILAGVVLVLVGLFVVTGVGRKRGSRLYRARVGLWVLALGLLGAGGVVACKGEDVRRPGGGPGLEAERQAAFKRRIEQEMRVTCFVQIPAEESEEYKFDLREVGGSPKPVPPGWQEGGDAKDKDGEKEIQIIDFEAPDPSGEAKRDAKSGEFRVGEEIPGPPGAEGRVSGIVGDPDGPDGEQVIARMCYVMIQEKREDRKPKVHVSAPPPHGFVGGKIDQEVLRKYLRPRVVAFKRCYEMALRKNLDAMGKLVLRVRVDLNGQATVFVLEDTTGEPKIGECAKRKLEEWSLPKPEGEPGEFDLPLVFRRL